jgi:hypothetical protein
MRATRNVTSSVLLTKQAIEKYVIVYKIFAHLSHETEALALALSQRSLQPVNSATF